MAVPSSGQLRLRADIALEIDGSATGSDVSLNTLSSSAGFTAPNGMEEFYGYVDAVAPSVSTDSTANVGTSTIRVYGTVSSDGGGTITQRGFYFGTSSNYASNTKYSVGGTTGGFNRYFSGLSSNTTHYYTAYAINSAGETRGTTKSQATSFAYTFKSPIYSQNFGPDFISGGLYYSNVNGGWSLRSSYNFNAGYKCVSVPTNRQSRSQVFPQGYGNYITIQKSGGGGTPCGNAPSLSISGVSKVVGDYYSNSSSYLKCKGIGSGHDFRFTAT